MSGSWNNPSFQQGLPGQVKLFDPTQFQAPMSTPGSGAPGGQASTQQPAAGQSSWNSWGSWDWNSDNTNTSAAAPTSQPGGFAGGAGTAAQGAGNKDQPQQSFFQGNNSSGQAPQYSQAWNQGWDGVGLQRQESDQQYQQQPSNEQFQRQQSDQQYQRQQSDHQYQQPQADQQFQQHQSDHQYQQQQTDQQFQQPQPDQQYQQQQFDQQFQQPSEQQYPAYDQPGAVGGPYDQQHVQQYQQPPSSGEASDQSQWGNNAGPQQFYGGQYFNQQPQQDFPSQEEQQQQRQFFEESFPPQHLGHEPSPPAQPHLGHEPSPPPAQHSSVDPPQQQGVSIDQGQPHQAYYDQPYEASSWNPAPHGDPWGGQSVQQQPSGEQQQQHDIGHAMVQNGAAAPGVAEEVEVPPSRESSVPPEGTSSNAPPQQRNPVLDAFDDNDNDGTVSGFFGKDDDGDIPSESPRLGVRGQLPVHQQLSFHRTPSDISNTSLATLNLPQGEGGDEEDGDPLHHIQELVQRMEETHLAQAGAFQGGELALGMSGDSAQAGLPPASFPTGVYSGGGDQAHEQGQHPTGDYSGFGGGVPGPEFNTASNKPDLPIDTDLRPASPDGDDHPGSGASGGSGGSSGLTDWEIVPSQASSGPSHSRGSSLDNGVSGGNSGSGFFSDRPDGGMTSNNSSATTTTISDSSLSASGNGAQPPPSDAGSVSDPIKLPPLSTGAPLDPSALGQRDGRSGSSQMPHVSQQPPVQTQPSSSMAHPPPPKLDVPSLSLPPQGAAGMDSGNPFRRDGNKSPRHAGLVQPTATAASTMLPPVTSPEKSQEQQGLTALPSRPKPPQASSSTDDGIPASRRREPDVGSGQRTSDDTSSSEASHRRHQSAFHPVSRPRHTAPSPATTLWDQGEGSSGGNASNILLAPAMPLIIPNLNAYSGNSATGTGSRGSETTPSSSGAPRAREPQQSQSKEETKRGGRDRRDEDPNKSSDSLDELDSLSREQKERSMREHREREERYRREAERDRPSSRIDRPHSRTSGHYHYDRDRPSSRADGYGRDDPYRRNRAYYRDYGDPAYDERYDRPRSRPDESRGSRPTSRTGQQDSMERPRSRANYDKDRDYYGRSDKHRGYGYDPYGRHTDYAYDERDRYYRYYKDREARYARGYYEEYYGANPEYYGRQGSRPTSRADYNRDYYYKGYDYSGYYYDGYGYDPYAYGYGYPGYDEQYNQGYDQGRLTPPKYSYPHTRACFGPGGQLVKVLPNRPTDGQPALVELQDTQAVLQTCPEAEELRKFPGPLTRNNTHKKDVLLFCQQKARECGENVSMTDRESAQLIWRLLELLIKQNGSVVGTDLSDLLLEGHEPSTHEYTLHGLRITQSQSPVIAGTGRDEEEKSSSKGDDSPALRVTQDRTVITSAGSADLEREAWIDRFRHLLLYGRKKDALECAMKNNLWGHALFLASKMDSRTHANVMTRFANSAMRMNDPLQTLYQLMSNRQPAAVTCVSDERWGNWRPHLAMMLSNQTERSDLDRKSICTLGDTLASKGYLHASHFCYLMAQVSLGTYFKKTSKIVLIGSSHTLPMEEFATTESIQCTEVYEYAQLLGNPAFCLPHFQIYKYLYACRLADYGMTPEALYYCEVIANIIQQCPAWFKPAFVKLVYQLSSKLKFSDPQRLHTSVDAEDPLWIQQLNHISQAYEDGSLQPVSGSATPANLVGGTSTSSESGDYAAGYYNNSYGAGSGGGYGGGNADVSANMSSMAGMDAAYSGQQVDATGHYTGQQTGTDVPDHSQLGTIPEGQQHQAPAQQSQQQQQHDVYQQQQQQQDPSQGQVDYTQQQQQQQWNNYGQWQSEEQGYQHHHSFSESSHHHYQQLQRQQQQEQLQQQQQQHPHYHHHHQHHHQHHGIAGGDVAPARPPSPPGSSEITADDVEDRSSIGGGSQFDASSASSALYGQGFGAQQEQQQQHPQQFPAGGLPPRASITTNETTEDEDNDNDDGGDDEVDASASGFDYFGNVGQKVVAPPHRYRTQSGSSSQGGRRRRTTSGSSTGSVKAAPNKGPATTQPAPKNTGDDKKQTGQQGQQGPQGSGWFGGLFSKFGRKGKNEMILPDDKNPAIVWDPAKQKWVNADGTEEESHSAAPPPKDTDLFGKPPGPAPPSTDSVNTSSGVGGAGPPPPPQSSSGANRFSLKAKGARNQYVDVNNPKPLAVPSSLFNVMPGATPAAAAAPQVYMPGSAPTSNAVGANTNNSSQGLLSVPDNSDQPSASETGNVTDPASSSSAAPQMPMLFNPASLKSGAQSGQGQGSSTGSGLKYGQRRAYPKQ